MLRPSHLRTIVCVTLVVVCGSCSKERKSNRLAAHLFSEFVGRYLDGFAKRHPSIAAGNGLHMHDDELEDFTRAGIEQEMAWYRAVHDTLKKMDTVDFNPDEVVDRQILLGIMDGWLLELGTAKNWQRNPMIYASAVSDGVHNLMTMESDSASVRMRRIIAKLSHLGELLQAESDNLHKPPALLVRRGIDMFRGAAGMLRGDLRTAFATAGSQALRDSLFAAADSAANRIDAHAVWLEKKVLPLATGKIALGEDYVRRRYRDEEMIRMPLDSMLALGERELEVEERAFVDAARRVDSTRAAAAVWNDVLRDHPKRGELVAATRRAVDELQRFVTSADLVRIPKGEKVIVEPSRPYDIGLASMHAAPPLETAAVKSIYYVTDADSSWPEDRQEKWLQHYNVASLSITSAHEAMPGHWVHSLFMRHTPGKVRRIWIGLNPFPQPSSGQDGWAHYAEYLVIEQGFKADDPRYAMAQLSESMTRICRLIAGIRVHTELWTIDQAAKFFEEKAHVPAPAARQEAERTSYDPTNGGYFLGKRALLKLRKDYQAHMGRRFSLREFHQRVMENGIAPWWAHRYLMLPGDTSAIIE